LLSSAYEKSIGCSLVLNSDKFFPCTRAAGNRFHNSIIALRPQKNARSPRVDRLVADTNRVDIDSMYDTTQGV